MSRFALVAAVGVACGVPGEAGAQFRGGFGGFGGPNIPAFRTGPLSPSGSLGVFSPNLPFPGSPRAFGGVTTPYGGYIYPRTFYGPVGLALYRDFANPPSYYSAYPPSGSGYMSGGIGNPALDSARADLDRAQKAAAAALPARAAIHDQWAYEKLGVPGAGGVKAGPDAPEAVARALAATDEREIATGEPLNHLLVAALAAEKKAGKVESAFLPPNLLADLKFAGPKADALNLIRRAGRLDYPAGFDLPGMADARVAVDREFAAAVSPVVLGKAADPTKAARLADAVAKARAAFAPQVKDLSFEDAAAARRFLNQMDAVARTLKGPSTAGLIDPAWGVEGTNVAGLVRYMGRHDLLFAPADRGAEDRYAAAHRGLGAYLFNLTEAQKKK